MCLRRRSATPGLCATSQLHPLLLEGHTRPEFVRMEASLRQARQTDHAGRANYVACCIRLGVPRRRLHGPSHLIERHSVSGLRASHRAPSPQSREVADWTCR